MFSSYNFPVSGVRFHKALVFSFYVLVTLLAVVLVASIIITDRDSFYEKISPSICTEITGEFQFDYEAQARLATASPQYNCASWESVDLPHFQEMPEYAELPEGAPLSRLWMHFKYTVPHDLKSSVGLAVYSTRVVGGIFSVYVDDKLFFTNQNDWYMQWNYPFYMELPLSYLEPGNEIDIKIAVPYRKVSGFSIGSFYVGDVRMLKKWEEWRTFFSIHLPAILSILFVSLGIISLVLSYYGIDPINNRLFFIISVIYAISNMQFIYNLPDNRSVEYWYLSITDASISWFFTASTIYAARYTKANLIWVVNIVILWALTITIVTLPIWDWQVIGFLLQHYIAMFLYMLLMMVLIYVSIKEKNYTLAGITLCMSIYLAGGFYDLTHVSDQSFPDGYYIFTYATTPLMFFFLVSLLSNYVTSHKTVLQHNDILKQELNKQKQELDIQKNQLSEQSKIIAVKDERVRVMRDLHDGVVSNLNLMSLAPPKSSQEYQSLLKECADDVQCIVLSLQVEATSLNAVLASLRNKLDANLYGTGIELRWQVDDISVLEWVGSSEALHILFLLKEAVNNAIKHSKCTVIQLGSRMMQDNNVLFIELYVQDNGRGYLLEKAETGNGRRNMQYRADVLGGQLLRDSSNMGTSISLRLPIKK